MARRIHIIGAGFSSMSAACYLAKEGYEVTVLEQNEKVGGRARQFEQDGFVFDMGPTWYWMPDVFERFFSDFGKRPSDYYQLTKLDPAYTVYFGCNDRIDIPDNPRSIAEVFQREEPGSERQVKAFLDKAKEHYEIAVGEMVYKPGESILELITWRTATRLRSFLCTIRDEVRATVKSDRLRSILEFPVLFLGAKPQTTPAFYSFMNHADFGLGTWYPKGGMYSVVEAIKNLSIELGVTYKTGVKVTAIECSGKKVTGIEVDGTLEPCDMLLSGADYHHTETLLPEWARGFSERYWDKKTFAPSALLFYVGFDKKIENVEHHTLCFDVDFDTHAQTIYDSPSWPSNPLFYASFPSITEPSCAPKGCESAIFLIPLAPDLEDDDATRERYFELVISRLESLTNQVLSQHVLFKKSYCVSDFKKDYNAFKGNAYGLANILSQTAFMRPPIRSKKLSNLFFTGQLTVPGPGVPPALISGKLAAQLIKKQHS